MIPPGKYEGQIVEVTEGISSVEATMFLKLRDDIATIRFEIQRLRGAMDDAEAVITIAHDKIGDLLNDR
jgi:hypothetical protein